MTSPRRRAPRRDALANRERIVDAAERAFDTEGVDTSLHQLVDGIDIGIGTLYRHFPTRDDLIRAVFDRQAERMTEVFARADAIEDGWDAMVACLDGVLALLLEHPSMGALTARMAEIDPAYGPAVTEWHPRALSMLARGHAQGTIRPDVTAMDVSHLPALLAPLGTLPQPARDTVIARLRGIMLDGLRPDRYAKVPLPAIALSPEVLHALSQGRSPYDEGGPSADHSGGADGGADVSDTAGG